MSTSTTRIINPKDIFNNDVDIRRVLMQLVNGFYSPDNADLFRPLYDALLEKDQYFILKDFRSYEDAQRRVEEAYRDEEGWTRKAMLNVAHAGKFSSDRTIQEYVDDIWHLDKLDMKS